MTLQQLRYFQLACYERNISRAAERLHVSQSSVSVAIKKLEQEFGVPLIKRQRVGFVLTAEGQEVLPLIEGLLDHADRTEQFLADQNRKYKPLRLGIPPMLCTLFSPALFAEMEKTEPKGTLVLEEAGGHELLQKLQEKTIDMALLPMDESVMPEGMEGIRIARLEDVCCVSKHSLLLQKSSVSVKELSAYPLVFFSDSFYHYNRMTRLFEEAEVPANILCRTSQLSTMEQLIAKGIALGFLFRERAEQLNDIGWLHLEPKVFTEIALVWKKGVYFTRDMQHILKFLRNQGGTEDV